MLLPTREAIIIGAYDNTHDFVLESGGFGSGGWTALDLSSVIRIDGRLNNLSFTSLNNDSDPVRWAQNGYQLGEVRCELGNLAGLTPGLKRLYLITYDPTHPEGVVFGPYILQAVDIG